MSRRSIFLLLLPLLVPALLRADEGDRFVALKRLPDGNCVVVAEGEKEPRSTGSYAIRLYRGKRDDHPTDQFLAGLVRPRDGTVERVIRAEVGSARPAVIVVIRSVGTGGFLSADAFSTGGGRVRLLVSVRGLAKDADPVARLREALRAKP